MFCNLIRLLIYYYSTGLPKNLNRLAQNIFWYGNFIFTGETTKCKRCERYYGAINYHHKLCINFDVLLVTNLSRILDGTVDTNILKNNRKVKIVIISVFIVHEKGIAPFHMVDLMIKYHNDNSNKSDPTMKCLYCNFPFKTKASFTLHSKICCNLQAKYQGMVNFSLFVLAVIGKIVVTLSIFLLLTYFFRII